MVKKSAPYLSPFENNGGSNFRKFVLPSVRHICISSGENLKMGGGNKWILRDFFGQNGKVTPPLQIAT